jgi:hypothetical protein
MEFSGGREEVVQVDPERTVLLRIRADSDNDRAFLAESALFDPIHHRGPAQGGETGIRAADERVRADGPGWAVDPAFPSLFIRAFSGFPRRLGKERAHERVQRLPPQPGHL